MILGQMSLEYLLVSESKEMLHTQTHTHTLMGGLYVKNQLKELP